MRYYVISDVHSFYSEMLQALTEKGFFEDMSPHKLIVCGDLFDRGSESVELQKFICELLKRDEVILVRGNHEDLRMTASEVDSYKHNYHSNKLNQNDIALTESGLRSMNNLLGEIEKIKPTYPDKRWEFWFSVPRGSLKQYIKFNKYYW